MSGKSRARHKKRKAKPSAEPALSPADNAGGQTRPALHIPAYLPWLLLLGWLAGVAWFLCDDAFIGFRYVRNLVEGHGLVFNPGEYVEGYTNFLWVLELAAIWSLLGIPPEQSAPVLSVVYTAGTLGAMLWWVYRLPGLSQRGLVGWMALGLVCSSATFAVWTSGGGLETRQFTFFLVAGVVALSVHGSRRRGLLLASLMLGLAELTRPEGLLLGACCLGGFALCRMARERRLLLDWRDLTVMGGPFVFIVAGHYLWRYSYYGEWLPNTYYAKYVAPWYDAGLHYLAQAGIETGLYLLLPLALLAAIVRWKRSRDGTYAVILLLLFVHMNYLARIGGDHFEYRPLDFYWPLLAVAAAEGLLVLGMFMAAWGKRWNRFIRPRAWALALFAPVLLYAGAIQGALLYEGTKPAAFTPYLHTHLSEANAGKWLVAPGMSKLVAVSNALRKRWVLHDVGSPWMNHRLVAEHQLPRWEPYRHVARGTIPDDAVGAVLALGIESYYQPDLKIIDFGGLADKTIARNPNTQWRDGERRRLAHERQPPPGYLKQRGVNFSSRPVARSMEEALSRARYALEVGPGLWLPFESNDHRWVAERFADRGLRSRPAQ